MASGQNVAAIGSVGPGDIAKPGRGEEIVGHAVDLIVNDGYAAFNLRKVAAMAGVRMGTVQYYYPTREILLLETLDRVFSRWGAQYREILGDSTVVPEERLMRLQDLAREMQVSTSATRFQLELSALAQHDDAVRLRIDRAYLAYRGQLVGALAEIRPDLGKAHLQSFATLLAAQWEGLSFFTSTKDRDPAALATLNEVARASLGAFIANLKSFQPLQRD